MNQLNTNNWPQRTTFRGAC